MKTSAMIAALFFTIACFGQDDGGNPTTTVTTQVTQETVNSQKAKVTRETTINHLAPFDTIVKITTEFEPASLIVSSQTQTRSTTTKLVPALETSLENFRNAKILLLKAQVQDNQYQFTYLDKDEGKRLKMYVAPITRYNTMSHWEMTGIWALNAPISIATVPFKVRPDIQNRGQVAKTTTNVGVVIPVFGFNWNRLFADGGTSIHSFTVGGIVAPALEDLDLSNTNGGVLVKQSNIVLSTGLSLTYTYNSEISFSAIPLGGDFGLDSDSKKWVYNQRYWWGFGIGITPTLLWRIFK